MGTNVKAIHLGEREKFARNELALSALVYKGEKVDRVIPQTNITNINNNAFSI
jgi:hypothetical protein